MILINILFIFLFVEYLIAPIAIRFTLKVPENYKLQQLNWGDVISFQTPSFNARHGILIQLGFVPAVATRLDNVEAAYYCHPKDPAIACIMVNNSSVFTEFTQIHISGTCLDISDYQLPVISPRWSKRITYQLSRRDILKLFKAFEKIRDRISLGSTLTLGPLDILQYVENYSNAQLDHIVNSGFYSKVVSNGMRRVTLKGAFLMTWKLAWPSKPILMFFENRRAARAAA